MELQFKEDPLIAERANRVLEHLAGMDRGDVIYNRDIERITGVEVRTGSWQTIVNKVTRRMLAERGIQLHCFGKHQGYRLATVADQLQEIPRKRNRRAGRQLDMKSRCLSALPPDLLNMREKEERYAGIVSANETKKELYAEARRTEILSTPPPSNPR